MIVNVGSTCPFVPDAPISYTSPGLASLGTLNLNDTMYSSGSFGAGYCSPKMYVPSPTVAPASKPNPSLPDPGTSESFLSHAYLNSMPRSDFPCVSAFTPISTSSPGAASF